MLMIEPGCFAAISRIATACAAKNAARTLRLKIASKSSVLTSGSHAGRFMPALLTRMWNGSAASIAARVAATSVTSSASASALSPRARIAAAAASISACVRAASVTCAPAAASAEAAASPMPRPPPVTSARRPSRRNEGVFVSSMVIPGNLQPGGAELLRRLSIPHVAAPVAAHAHVRLLGVAEEPFEHAQARAVFADHRARLVGQHLLERAGLEEFPHPQPAGVARRLLG